MAREGERISESQEVRVSAFDVLIQHNARFLWTFYACWVTLTAVLSYARVVSAENRPLEWPEVAIIVIVAAAVCVGISFPLSFGLSEGIPMVLAKIIKNRYRAEGREERDRLWEAWNERRLTAEREGRPFTEPTPSSKSQNGSDRDPTTDD